LWDAATGKEEAVISGHTEGWIYVFWSPDGRRLAWHGYMSDLRILDVDTRSLERVLHHGSGILHVAWSPDGIRLASASQDGTVKLWVAATWQEDRVLHLKNRYYIDYMIWSPDGKRLAVIVFMDKTVSVWDVAIGSEERFRGPKAPVISVAWSPNGKQLAAGGYDGAIWIWDLTKTGR
jgi:WD40 repeat protein